LKLFNKREKQIVMNGYSFHIVINEIPSNEFVNFKVYSSKTSYFEVLFTWKGSWHFNPHKPKNCKLLIEYAITNGWEYTLEKQTLKIGQSDFLIEQLGLNV